MFILAFIVLPKSMRMGVTPSSAIITLLSQWLMERKTQANGLNIPWLEVPMCIGHRFPSCIVPAVCLCKFLVSIKYYVTLVFHPMLGDKWHIHC
jgi:hypothetical protein